MLYHRESKCFLAVHKKNGPDAVRDRLNFMGGKVDNNETFGMAHQRELEEEANLDLNEISTLTKSFVGVVDDNCIDFALYTINSGTPRPGIPNKNDVGEKLYWLPIYDLAGTVPNLKWIVPYLLDEDDMRIEG